MRILFNKGQQRLFLHTVRKKLNKTFHKIYLEYKEDLGISYTTFKRYYREELLLPFNVATSLSKISGINWRNFEIKRLMNDNWGQKKGGKIGYKNMIKKHFKKVERYRKSPEKALIGKNKKEIKTPQLNEELAEFIGICLGDGTLTKYFLRLSLNYKNEKPYSLYITDLCKKLFGVLPSHSKEKNKNTLNLKLFSVNVCKFLHEKFGLPYGDKIKNEARIPFQILKNEKLFFSCIRGLVDTDGTIGRNGIRFFSFNKILLSQIIKFNEIYNVFTSSDTATIGTSSKKKIADYFTKVGTSNLKYIVFFNEAFLKNRKIYVEDALKYFKYYQNIHIPFKLGVDSPAG